MRNIVSNVLQKDTMTRLPKELVSLVVSGKFVVYKMRLLLQSNACHVRSQIENVSIPPALGREDVNEQIPE